MSVVLKTNNKRKEERVTLFSIDGVAYDVPKRPRPSIGLKYLWNLKVKGQQMAEAELLGDMLGEEGFKALAGFEDLTQEDMDAVLAAVEQLALGEKEESKKSKKG